MNFDILNSTIKTENWHFEISGHVNRSNLTTHTFFLR